MLHQLDELRETHSGLIRLPVAAVHPGALAEARHLNTGIAEFDHWRARGRGLAWTGCQTLFFRGRSQDAGRTQCGCTSVGTQKRSAINPTHGVMPFRIVSTPLTYDAVLARREYFRFSCCAHTILMQRRQDQQPSRNAARVIASGFESHK